MSVLDRVVRNLRDLEAELAANPPVAKRIGEIARLLESDEARWIGTTRAKRLLGVQSENTVKAWARLGILRSRREPNGRLKVHLGDVLKRKVEYDALGGDWDESEMTEEELASLSRPLTPEEIARTNERLASLGIPPWRPWQPNGDDTAPDDA